METKKCLIMCRTGMGSSMMLKIKVDKLIDKNGYPMDVTHDAFSGFAGQQNVDIIITMEDLLEEIVGNIYDEFDPAESPEIEQLGENLWRVSGGASIGDLSEALGVKLPESESYDTVGGLIFTQLDFIPRDGSQLDLELCGLSLHVEEVREHRIERILIKKQEKPEISEI